jgi:hypothetical protein
MLPAPADLLLSVLPASAALENSGDGRLVGGRRRALAPGVAGEMGRSSAAGAGGTTSGSRSVCPGFSLTSRRRMLVGVRLKSDHRAVGRFRVGRCALSPRNGRTGIARSPTIEPRASPFRARAPSAASASRRRRRTRLAAHLVGSRVCDGRNDLFNGLLCTFLANPRR